MQLWLFAWPLTIPFRLWRFSIGMALFGHWSCGLFIGLVASMKKASSNDDSDLSCSICLSVLQTHFHPTPIFDLVPVAVLSPTRSSCPSSH